MKVYRRIKDSNNNITEIELFDIHESTYNGKDMGERSITATIEHPYVIDFLIGDFIRLDIGDLSGGHGIEEFYIYTLPSVKKIARPGSVMNAFEHTITFYPAQFELSVTQMRDIMQQNSAEDITAKNFIYTGYDEFSFFGGAHELMRRIKYVLDERFGNDYWNYMIAEAVDEDINDSLEDVQFDFSGNSVWEALTKLTDENGINTDFYIIGRMIYVGYKRSHIVGVDKNNIIQGQPFKFAYGKTSHLDIDIDHGNLFTITKTIGTTSPITRLYAYGASKNLNRFYASDRLRSGRYVSKLMLPSFNNDGKTDWIDSERGIEKFGIREGTKTFDEIYPTLRYVTYGDIRRIKYVLMVENSGLNDINKKSSIPLARIQCYKVTFNNNGVAILEESYPPSKIAVFVHATGKVVKCVLYPTQSEQSVADFGNLPKTSSGKVIAGACFAVHDSGYEDYLDNKHDRKEWFANIDNLPTDTDEQVAYKTEVELHQIEYTDDFWMTDVFIFDDNAPYDEQSYFPRDGYSAYCYPHINENYKPGSINSDSTLVNEIVAVEPVTVIDTDINKVDGTGQSTFVIYMRDFGFKIDEQAYSGQWQWLVNGDFQVNFLDGYMAGLNFNVSAKGNGVLAAYREDGTFNNDWYVGVDKTIAEQALVDGAFWRLICTRNQDNDNAWMPNAILNPHAGDHVVFLNIYMPDIYILAAEQRLLREAQKFINDNDNGDISYSLDFDKVRMAQIPAFGLQMREGAIMRIVDEDLKIYTENDEVYLQNDKNGLYAQMVLTSNDNTTTEYITNVSEYLYSPMNTTGMLETLPCPKYDQDVLSAQQPMFLKNGDTILYPKVDSVTKNSNETVTFRWSITDSKYKPGKKYLFGYITSTNNTVGAEKFLPFKQPFDILSGKHYTVVMSVTGNNIDDIYNDNHPVILVTGLGNDRQYYYPNIISIDKSPISMGYKIICQFDIPDSFNTTQQYYIAAGFKTAHQSINVSAYLYSVKQTNTDVDGDYAKYVDLTIDSLTIKMTDYSRNVIIGRASSFSSGENGNMNKEITAVVKERQKATAWTALSNMVKDTSVVSEKTIKTAEQLANQARRHYRELEALKNNIFDPDGTIKDVFLQTMLLQVGANSMNYTLDNTKVFNGTFRNMDFEANEDRTWSIKIGEDTLRHYVYTKGTQGGTWHIAAMNTPLQLDDEVYYISCKCSRDGSIGEWIIDNIQHKVDEDDNYWYFNYGIINTISGDHRDLTEIRGNVFVYGDNINAGKIMTFDGNSYFDLSGNTFKLGEQLEFKNGILRIGKNGGSSVEEILNATTNLKIGGRNLAIYSTARVVNMTKDGNYGFTQISADTKPIFNLRIDDYHGQSNYKTYVNNEIISTPGTYSFNINLKADTSVLRIKHNGSARDVESIFTFSETVKSGEEIVVSITFTNVTQGEFSWKNVMIERGNKATDWSPAIEDLEAYSDRQSGGENLYDKGDPTGTIPYYSTDSFLLSAVESGKTYVGSYQQASEWAQDSCLILKSGDTLPTASFSYMDVYYTYGLGNIDGVYKWGEPIPVNGNDRRVYALVGITYENAKRLFKAGGRIDNECLVFDFTPVEGLEYYFKGIMLQEGERATGYQAATKHLTDAIENGSTEVAGGLVMTNVLMLKNEQGNVTAGMSGLVGTADNPENVLMWGGGTYEQALNAIKGLLKLPVLLTKKGYGSNIGCFKVMEDNQTIRVESNGMDIMISTKPIQEIVASYYTFYSEGYTKQSSTNGGRVELMKYPYFGGQSLRLEIERLNGSAHSNSNISNPQNSYYDLKIIRFENDTETLIPFFATKQTICVFQFANGVASYPPIGEADVTKTSFTIQDLNDNTRYVSVSFDELSNCDDTVAEAIASGEQLYLDCYNTVWACSSRFTSVNSGRLSIVADNAFSIGGAKYEISFDSLHFGETKSVCVIASDGLQIRNLLSNFKVHADDALSVIMEGLPASSTELSNGELYTKTSGAETYVMVKNT